jgi:hypothetical protein
MKSLLSILALAAALGLAAGCGPQEAFCPNTSAKDAGGVCPINGDDRPITLMDMRTSLCDPGQHLGDNPDGNQEGTFCVCNSNNQLPPCP